MDDIELVLERHNEHILSLEKQIEDLNEVRSEIKNINITLMKLTTELKYTNQHLEKQEEKIVDFEKNPKQRLTQITSAIIAAIAGCAITMLFNSFT